MQSVHMWVDFKFIAHRPLRLRRASLSVRSQLPMRPVSGSVSSAGAVMNASSFSFSAHNPGADVNRFRFQQMHIAAQMCVRSRCKSGKIRLRRTVPLQIQRTRLGE